MSPTFYSTLSTSGSLPCFLSFWFTTTQSRATGIADQLFVFLSVCLILTKFWWVLYYPFIDALFQWQRKKYKWILVQRSAQSFYSLKSFIPSERTKFNSIHINADSGTEKLSGQNSKCLFFKRKCVHYFSST